VATSAEFGFSDEEFWSVTLREVFLRLRVGWTQRLHRELLNALVIHALIEPWRDRKKTRAVPLSTYMPSMPDKPTRSQAPSAEQVQAKARALQRMLGGTWTTHAGDRR
jgi:hypothetical protein